MEKEPPKGAIWWEKAGAGVRDIPLESWSCSPTILCLLPGLPSTRGLYLLFSVTVYILLPHVGSGMSTGLGDRQLGTIVTQFWGFLGAFLALKAPSIWYYYHPFGRRRQVGLSDMV